MPFKGQDRQVCQTLIYNAVSSQGKEGLRRAVIFKVTN